MATMPAARSSVSAREIRLGVPDEFGDYMYRMEIRGAAVLSIPFFTLLMGINVWRGNLSAWHILETIIIGFGSVIPFLQANPFSRASGRQWLYVLNETGIFWRNEMNPLSINGHPMLRWKRDVLLGTEATCWQTCPALRITFMQKGRQKQKLIVYRPEDESIIVERVMPFLQQKATKQN